MKNTRWAILALIALISLTVSPVSALPVLSVEVGFSNLPLEGVVAPVSPGATGIDFSSLMQSAPGCAGANMALCGMGSVVFSSTDFDSGVAFSMILGPSLTYTTSGPWSAAGGPGGSFSISTLGTYTAAGYDPTAGSMNLTFQPPPVAGNYSFSASGATSPVPEPSSIILMSGGLIGFYFINRRHQFRQHQRKT
ncbi:MAG TPA: PEP-CTERM sorting domain-containing protein [Candidatus Paceibacterota bacterium]